MLPAPDEPEGPPGLKRQPCEDDLRRTANALSLGTTDGADAALSAARQVFEETHDRRGAVALDAARDALARGDLFEARSDVASALRSIRR